MPDTNRRITELPIQLGPLPPTRALVTDQTGGASSQNPVQDIVDLGIRTLRLSSQLQKVDPLTEVPDLPAPTEPAATLGPLGDNPVLPTDGIPIVRRTASPTPYVEQVVPAKFVSALPTATPFEPGTMSAADKANLDNLVAGGGSTVLPSSIPLGRVLTGPTTVELLEADKGTLLQVNAVAGTVEITVAAGIETPDGFVLAGAINKKGSGTLRITAEGTPATAPALLATEYFGYGRNSDGASTFMAAQTVAKTLIVPTGGTDCAVYIFNATTPGVTGNTAGTLGLSIDGVAKAWDKEDRAVAGAEPIAPAIMLAAKALGTVADGAEIDIDIVVSASHWRSGGILVAVYSGVPQDNLFEAGTAECESIQTAGDPVLVDVVTSLGNRRILYAGFCRSGANGAALISATGATQLESGVNNDSAVVTSNVRACLAHEAAGVGVNDATFDFPSSQLHAYAALAIPPLTTGGMEVIMPSAGSTDITGVNQVFGWLYDDNAGTFQIV